MYFLSDCFRPLGLFPFVLNAGFIDKASAYKLIREKGLSPRRGPKRPLLPLSPKRTQVRLKSLLYLVWLTPDSLRTHGRPSGKSAVCGLNGLRPTLRVGTHLFRFSLEQASFRAGKVTAFCGSGKIRRKLPVKLYRAVWRVRTAEH